MKRNPEHCAICGLFVDDERIAALVAGRLSEADAAALNQHFDHAPYDRATFDSASAILRTADAREGVTAAFRHLANAAEWYASAVDLDGARRQLEAAARAFVAAEVALAEAEGGR